MSFINKNVLYITNVIFCIRHCFHEIQKSFSTASIFIDYIVIHTNFRSPPGHFLRPGSHEKVRICGKIGKIPYSWIFPPYITWTCHLDLINLQCVACINVCSYRATLLDMAQKSKVYSNNCHVNCCFVFDKTVYVQKSMSCDPVLRVQTDDRLSPAKSVFFR